MKLSSTLLISFLFVFIACSDDNNDVDDVACGQNWFLNENVEDALNDYTEAGIAYGQNSTSENCNTYKEATQDLIDVLESFRSCAVNQGTLQQWEENFDNARDDLDAIEC